MNAILKWIDDADASQPFTRSNAYFLMDNAAATQPASLRDTWNTVKWTNGVNGAPVYHLKSAANGLFLTTELAWAGDTYATLRARTASNALGPWEQFEMWVSDTTTRDFTLTAVGNNQYVTGEQTLSNGVLRARASVLGPWEKFMFQANSDATFSLWARSRNRWVSTEVDTDQTLHARATQVGPWEKYVPTQIVFVSQ